MASKQNGRVVEARAGSVATLRLDRPEARNALSFALRSELKRAAIAVEKDADVRVVVLSGTDDCFSAGADIHELGDDVSWPDHSSEATVWQALAERKKPLIAAVEGFALGGGCELVLLADIVIASRTARFAFPEVMRGLIPGAGGTQRFARIVGPQKALLYQLTGRVFSGETAFGMGFVSELTEEGCAFTRACELAQEIASAAPLAVEELRRLVWKGLDLPIDKALELEMSTLGKLRGTADFKEGVASFFERRSPKFSGR